MRLVLLLKSWSPAARAAAAAKRKAIPNKRLSRSWHKIGRAKMNINNRAYALRAWKGSRGQGARAAYDKAYAALQIAPTVEAHKDAWRTAGDAASLARSAGDKLAERRYDRRLMKHWRDLNEAARRAKGIAK